MLACFNRSGLTVNDETPTVYFPDSTPAMIVPKSADWYFAVSPSFDITALNRSMSKPSTVLPSPARNSLGAYDESVPTVTTPALRIAAGTLAAKSWSDDTFGAGDFGPPPVLVPLPHPASATLSTTIPATASRAVRPLVPLISPPGSSSSIAAQLGNPEVCLPYRRIGQQLRPGPGP